MSQENKNETYSISISDLKKALGDKISEGKSFEVKDVFTGETTENTTGVFEVNGLAACDNFTVIVSPKE